MQPTTLSKLIHWYITSCYIKILKKKIEYHISNSSNELHKILFKCFVVQNTNTLWHKYIGILILMTKIEVFNLHGNLRTLWKRIYRLNNLKEKKVHRFNIKCCEQWIINLGVGTKWLNVFWMYHNYNFCIILLLCSHLILNHKISWKHDMVYGSLFMCQSYFHFFFLIFLFHLIFITILHFRVLTLPFIRNIFWILKLDKRIKKLKNICKSNCTLDLV